MTVTGNSIHATGLVFLLFLHEATQPGAQKGLLKWLSRRIGSASGIIRSDPPPDQFYHPSPRKRSVFGAAYMLTTTTRDLMVTVPCLSWSAVAMRALTSLQASFTPTLRFGWPFADRGLGVTLVATLIRYVCI